MSTSDGTWRSPDTAWREWLCGCDVGWQLFCFICWQQRLDMSSWVFKLLVSYYNLLTTKHSSTNWFKGSDMLVICNSYRIRDRYCSSWLRYTRIFRTLLIAVGFYRPDAVLWHVTGWPLTEQSTPWCRQTNNCFWSSAQLKRHDSVPVTNLYVWFLVGADFCRKEAGCRCYPRIFTVERCWGCVHSRRKR